MPEVKCPKCGIDTEEGCRWELMYGDGGARCSERVLISKVSALESTVATLRKALGDLLYGIHWWRAGGITAEGCQEYERKAKEALEETK